MITLPLFKQVISILLEKYSLPELAEKIVFIAGHKVTNDPVAIPFSMVSGGVIHFFLSYTFVVFTPHYFIPVTILFLTIIRQLNDNLC